MFLRNDGKKDLIPNGKRRHGQFEWHNENCQVEDHGIQWSNGKPFRMFWCATHGQWASESVVSITYAFEDGVKLQRNY